MAREPHTADQLVVKLRQFASEKNRIGMARYGIATQHALGVSMPSIRAVARQVRHDHELALALWNTGFHEARILAALVDKPQWVTPQQMDRWVGDFNSWDLCDQVCGNLFERSEHAAGKIAKWAADEREFVRRAAFAMVAWQAVHDKDNGRQSVAKWLALIRRHSSDPRNFVKKSVNWALRQIAKSSAELYPACLALARELAASENKTQRWIGRDAVKELESEAVRKKLGV